ncbi:PQQ-dependent catabolism-associated CXXCW motif protein [Denitrificimonas sp. JX-1]|uniref:PQQ-dependent catabolism-associated CXXCW motif protein n=1 Tax=Denitrificimonas halotolerans TaxID=3098930 RepID=A0ABU5GTL5_9GAMM|nr:PQQ-dependent catabolism-associated CXXCW motif protein [Denitrificimonas sp. JX-1]MDY7220327.1 PQQ-dependent catabolism-associated CXXCW motif protein [Denitrificimonas sp. JX-1]
MLKPICTALVATLTLFGNTYSYAQNTDLFNEAGYRSTLYRSPTPQFHELARTLDPQQLLELQAKQPQVLLIDVYRNPWLRGYFTLSEVHQNLPNSLWLANCGDGALSEQWMAYCRQHLEQATAGNKAHPIVFYCRSDCWLGWNAIKRAHHLGYTNLYWLRDGIDGWAQANLPLKVARPEAVQSTIMYYKNETKNHVQHLNR